MIRIQQLKLPLKHTKEDLIKKAAKKLRLSEKQILSCDIVKRSIDARKKQEVCYVYTVDVKTACEKKVSRLVDNKNIMLTNRELYQIPVQGNETLSHRPVIAGSGPAGLFCAYLLAKSGYRPLLIERGKSMEKRTKDVADFWSGSPILPESNVQFGEGGAGTFSDGKLNTLVKDKGGRNKLVLDTFVQFGAPQEIIYEAKPHLGTDILSTVIPNIRNEIIRLGGEVRFETCLTNIRKEGKRLSAIELNHSEWVDTQILILAVGHSARDTFSMLHSLGILMEAKSFAVGLRVEHPQALVNISQYGMEAAKLLGPAPYKLAYTSKSGRGVYSFCMCPGGYVVNASSERKRLAVNGMSYSKRDSQNANSAVIVSVTPRDFPDEGPLAGVSFQRILEERAYCLGHGTIPQQLYGDFKKAKESNTYGKFASETRGEAVLCDISSLLPGEIRQSFIEGMEAFEHKIPGFSREDAILSGVESRTSSPIRILRDRDLNGSINGLYPCGEGAGYAGGIMSAAMDGIKTAEAVISKYALPEFS